MSRGRGSCPRPPPSTLAPTTLAGWARLAALFASELGGRRVSSSGWSCCVDSDRTRRLLTAPRAPPAPSGRRELLRARLWLDPAGGTVIGQLSDQVWKWGLMWERWVGAPPPSSAWRPEVSASWSVFSCDRDRS